MKKSVSKMEEAVEVAAEPVEDEPAPAPKEKGRPQTGSNRKRAILAVIVVLILGGGIFAVYSFMKGGDEAKEPEAHIFVSDADVENVLAGTMVTFDASSTVLYAGGEGALAKYSWEFGDGQSGSGKVVKHAFLDKGTYQVNLTVTDSEGLEGTASVKVTVVGMAIMVPIAKEGDVVTYDVYFVMDFSNPDGFWTYTEETHPTPFTTVTMTASVTQVHIEADQSQNPVSKITTGLGMAEDGFDQVHSCVDRENIQEMPFTGWAIVKLIPKTGAPQTVNRSLSGDSSAKENVYTDLNTNRTVKTIRSDDYSMKLGAGGTTAFAMSGSDLNTAYPKKREEFSVEALRENRTFRTGDSGIYDLGPTKLYWDVVGEDNVNGVPCLMVHMALDDETMSENSLTEFSTYLWLASSFSAPLKITMHMLGGQGGNTFYFDYSSTFTSNTLGDSDIPFGTCTAITPDGHFYETRPSVDYAPPENYGPAMGPGSASLADYPLSDAVDYAKKNSQGLTSYLDDNPDAYLIDASCNNTDGMKWNLTFGTKSSTSAYNVIVAKTQMLRQGSVTVDAVTRSVYDYDTPLTFTGAEDVFKSRPEIVEKAYSGDKIDLTKNKFGAKSDVPYANTMLSRSEGGAEDATEYYFYVSALDGSFSAGVDAGNGQILFVNTHSS